MGYDISRAFLKQNVTSQESQVPCITVLSLMVILSIFHILIIYSMTTLFLNMIAS